MAKTQTLQEVATEIAKKMNDPWVFKKKRRGKSFDMEWYVELAAKAGTHFINEDLDGLSVK